MFHRSTLVALLLAAIIPFNVAMYTGPRPEAQALSWGSVCRWYGTAPFCKGECPWGYSTVMRAKESPSLGLGKFRYTDNSFGQICVTGKKALCCTD